MIRDFFAVFAVCLLWALAIVWCIYVEWWGLLIIVTVAPTAGLLAWWVRSKGW